MVSISAKVDYGVRALCTLAEDGGTMTAAQLAACEGLPTKYLESILTDLRKADVLVSRRGVDGGYQLARPASELRLSDVVRPLVGTLAEVRGQAVDTTRYDGAAQGLQEVWVTIRATLRNVLEEVTIADVVAGTLPASVRVAGHPPERVTPT